MAVYMVSMRQVSYTPVEIEAESAADAERLAMELWERSQWFQDFTLSRSELYAVEAHECGEGGEFADFTAHDLEEVK